MKIRPYTITIGPAVEPVTLSEVKAQLGIVVDDDDAILSALIVAAREYVENYTRRLLIDQTIAYTLQDFPACDTIYIPAGPVSSVTSITYYDSDGVEQTLSADNYSLRATESPPEIVLIPSESWPSTDSDTIDAVTITVACGYGASGDDVPESIVQAIVLKVRDLYDLESSEGEYLALAIKALLNPYILWWA